jgi:hypothetical protein
MTRFTWVPYVAAIAGAALIIKGSLIIATDNAISEDAMGVLYLGGLALGVVAAVGAGLRQRGWLRGLLIGFGSALGLILWIMGVGDAIKPVIGLVSSTEHVQVEVPVVLAGLVVTALALRARSRDAHLVSTRRS